MRTTQAAKFIMQQVQHSLSAALNRVSGLKQQLQGRAVGSESAHPAQIKVESTKVKLHGATGQEQEVASATAPAAAPTTASSFIPPKVWERLYTVSRMVNEVRG